MPIDIALRSHLSGSLSTHFKDLMTRELQALPEVRVTEDAPPDHELFVAGGVVQPEGYEDPTFVLVAVATHTPDRETIEEIVPPSSHPDRNRLIARLGARRTVFERFSGCPPQGSKNACVNMIATLDEIALERARRSRSGS